MRLGILGEKFKEVLLSVLPVTAIVLVLSGVFWLTGHPLPPMMMLYFLLGVVLIIAGLSVFLLGVDVGIVPLATHIGGTLSKSNRLWLLAAAGLVIGFFICIAEPDLQILAGQIEGVTSGTISKMSILIVVSSGIAVMLVLGLVRIVYNFPQNVLLTMLYGVILIIGLFTPPEILAISFDASGATTGALTVPFILALALGISSLKKDSKTSEEDSFGLVGVTSTGAIIGVLMLGLLKRIHDLTGSLPEDTSESVVAMILEIVRDSFVAILPLFVIFVVFQATASKFPKRQARRVIVGLTYNCLGLILFLVGVNIGFMDLGVELGATIVGYNKDLLIIALGFMIGFVTIMAEPAVYVLMRQIEDVTSGYVKRNIVLGALAIGVGLAVGLSMLRILSPGIQLWHYLLPGFVMCVLLSFFTPKLFVGIGFDSGGVASGPMTATFILAFSQGVASATAGADVLKDAFGMISMVAMMPIITIEILGLIFKFSLQKGGVDQS
jgi:hypothetical protein